MFEHHCTTHQKHLTLISTTMSKYWCLKKHYSNSLIFYLYKSHFHDFPLYTKKADIVINHPVRCTLIIFAILYMYNRHPNLNYLKHFQHTKYTIKIGMFFPFVLKDWTIKVLKFLSYPSRNKYKHNIAMFNLNKQLGT